MVACQEDIDTAGENLSNKIWDCLAVIRALRRECENNPRCKLILKDHLEICQEGCTRNFVSYECQFKNSGRCIHYYNIEEEVEKKDYYDEILSLMHERFSDAEYEYKRHLAKKEDRMDEYRAELESDYENWSFNESMRITEMLRRSQNEDDDW
jgi:hypothetical protein